MALTIRRSVALALVATLHLAAAAHALSGSTLTGVVTAGAPDSGPVAGAFVALTRAGGEPRATVTDAAGAFIFEGLADDDYTLAAHATGYAVAQSPITISGDGAQNLTLTPSGTVFETLGVFGGQIASLAADATTGVFYASTSVIPQVFRTADYGGTWTPATPASDDPGLGLAGNNVAGGLTTSGFPGEVAVDVGGTVYYSTDFGTTWHAVANPGGTPGGGAGVQLLWGHAGTTNVLLRISGTDTLRADMSATTPTFAAQTPSYLTGAADRIAVGVGDDGAWVAVVSVAGTLDVYDLATNPPGPSVTTLAGLPAPPTLVRLGGQRGTGVPPDAILVFSSSANAAVMATKSGGTTFTSASASTTVPMGCGQGAGSVGAVTPLSTGTTGAGTLSQCFVAKTGTDPLAFTTIPGINNNTGLVFDAFYGINAVALSGDGNRGIVKSASTASDVPVFPVGVAAAPGADPTSGGVAVNGLTVPVVKDTGYGPAGATQVATALSGSGGGLSVASDDGGATFTTVVGKGGNAVDWWQGSSAAWMVVGHGGAGTLVTAVADWTSAATPLPGPNVAGLDAGALGATGMAEQFAVTAVEGVAGADVVFIGGGSNVDQTGTGGTVFRGTLSNAGPIAITGGTVLSDPLIGPRAVRALAYCAAIGTDSDVLFVATANDSTGTLVRVVAASGPTPVVTEVFTGTRVNAVRAHCASGVVYAGTGSNMGGPTGGLQGSTDGGVTFAPIPIAGAGLPPNLNVQVVAVDPTDGAHLLVAGNSEGFILESTDAGATWALVNAPTAPGGRNFLSEGVGDLEIAATTSPLARAAGDARTLVGTGGGLFAASFPGEGGGGGGGGGCTSEAQCDDGDACTTDACASATCTHTPLAGADGVRCALAGAPDAIACADAKLQRQIAKRLGRVRALLDKYVAAVKPAKANRLRTAMQRQVAAAARKVGKAKKSDADCKAAIGARLDGLAELVRSLGT